MAMFFCTRLDAVQLQQKQQQRQQFLPFFHPGFDFRHSTRSQRRKRPFFSPRTYLPPRSESDCPLRSFVRLFLLCSYYTALIVLLEEEKGRKKEKEGRLLYFFTFCCLSEAGKSQEGASKARILPHYHDFGRRRLGVSKTMTGNIIITEQLFCVKHATNA